MHLLRHGSASPFKNLGVNLIPNARGTLSADFPAERALAGGSRSRLKKLPNTNSTRGTLKDNKPGLSGDFACLEGRMSPCLAW
jgi:hypothetical protein